MGGVVRIRGMSIFAYLAERRAAADAERAARHAQARVEARARAAQTIDARVRALLAAKKQGRA